MDTEFLINQLIGTKYVSWNKKQWSKDNKSPFYISKEKEIDIEYVRKNGCNCAGFINILLRNKSIPIPDYDSDYPGGTFSYGFEFKWTRIDLKKQYPKYTLFLSPYISGINEGHLSILLPYNHVAHCYLDKGVVIEKINFNNYEYVCTELCKQLT